MALTTQQTEQLKGDIRYAITMALADDPALEAMCTLNQEIRALGGRHSMDAIAHAIDAYTKRGGNQNAAAAWVEKAIGYLEGGR